MCECTCKPEKTYSVAALDCLVQMSQANTPTYKEFLAAWEEGLIDTTEEGERIIGEIVYNRHVSN